MANIVLIDLLLLGGTSVGDDGLLVTEDETNEEMLDPQEMMSSA